MNRQRRAESFAQEVSKYLKECNLNLPTEELLSSGYYWGISEVIGELEMLLTKSELEDSSVENTNVVNAIRKFIRGVV